MEVDIKYDMLGVLSRQTNSKITELKAEARQIDSQIDSLLSSWNGSDKDAFMVKWRALRDSKSEYGKMIKLMEEYANLLQYAEKSYRDIQVDAVNRAKRIVAL